MLANAQSKDSADDPIAGLISRGEYKQAVARCVETHGRSLGRLCMALLGSQSDAEEAVQETLLSAFKSAHTFNERFSFRTWLWTILLNQCRTQLKRRGRSQVVAWTDAGDSLPEDDAPRDQQPLPTAMLISRERTEFVERLLARLPDKEADALRLRFFGELKFQEVADAVRCSLATAKNRVKSGLLRMAEMMGEGRLEIGGEYAVSSRQ